MLIIMIDQRNISSMMSKRGAGNQNIPRGTGGLGQPGVPPQFMNPMMSMMMQNQRFPNQFNPMQQPGGLPMNMGMGMNPMMMGDQFQAMGMNPAQAGGATNAQVEPPTGVSPNYRSIGLFTFFLFYE